MMKREALMQMAEFYMKREGFRPGAIVLNEKDIPEILEVYKDILLPTDYKFLEESVEKNPKFLESIRLFKMGFRLTEDDKPIHLERQTGKVTQMRPQEMSVMYNPSADITNSLASIMQASFAFFSGLNETSDPVLCQFATDCATILHDAKNKEVKWEEHALPKLHDMCGKLLNGTDMATPFFARFFTCVVDFYWHCCRLSMDETPKKNIDMIQKATNLSSLIRTMPKDMQKEYMDHLVSHGTLPDIFEAMPKEK